MPVSILHKSILEIPLVDVIPGIIDPLSSGKPDEG
jgi:hypothetical protein